MKEFFIDIPYDASRDEIRDKTKEMMRRIYTDALQREPTAEDQARIENRFNPDDVSIQDIYFDGEKVGALRTNLIGENKGLRFSFHPLVL